MKPRLFAGLLAALALLAAGPARADDVDGGPLDIRPLFSRGRVELAAGGGYGVYNDKSYLLLQLGGGYYLSDGLSAGLTGEAWLGSVPQIYDVSPNVRCVFLDSPLRYKPYAGVFYRRTSYSRLSGPVDSAGARGGLVFPLTRRAYLTAGLAFEHAFQYAPSVSSSRDLIYPEIGLEFGF